jgi:SAM-dependent methyltransferase
MNTADGYYDTRYAHDPRRQAVWRHVTHHLQRWVPADADVLELGAGYCDFSNNVVARSRVAMDLRPQFAAFAAAGVRIEVGDCSDLSRFADDSFDVVFASNLLEHLDLDANRALVQHARRVLRPGGRLVLVQPNYRLRPREYFDDYTHVTVFSDRSLPDFLAAEGLVIEHVRGRFLPFTMKSRLSFGHHLVPLYLRLPYRPLAGQMLVVAARS